MLFILLTCVGSLKTGSEEGSFDTDMAEDSSMIQTEFGKHRIQKSLGTLLPSLSAIKDILLIIFAMVGLVMSIQPLKNINEQARTQPAASLVPSKPVTVSCDCGNSTKEAFALGCKYDSLAAAWLPEHCRDDELTKEFERSGPGVNGQWTYWSDKAHTKEISIEEIAMMADDPEQRFYMTGHWHVIHCIFYWRKEHRARFNGKSVEPRSDSEHHIKHCGKIFLDPGVNTRAGVPLNTDRE
jgi:hypothetical protein